MLVKLLRAFDLFLSLLFFLGGTLLVFIVFITISDIISRVVWKISAGEVDFTFIGSVEVIQYSLLLSIFLSLPYALDKSQIIITTFTEKISPANKKLISSFYFLGFSFFSGAMSYGFYNSLLRVISDGDVSQDLSIPLKFIYMIVFFSSSVLMAQSLRLLSCDFKRYLSL